ncbi:hypothetical protein [Pseudomonas koreensis]|uniref:hypothetical protein n=1 Tax=Pseudomonas koreensis TaxID=198620 RepID=UPI0037FE4659
MEKSEYIQYLFDLKCQTSLGERLRELLILDASDDFGIEMVSGKINLSALCRTLQCDRQLFYPGRGNEELASLIAWANSNPAQLNQRSQHISGKPKKARSRYKSEFQRLATENSKLRADLLKFSSIEESLLNGKIISLPPC